MRAPGEPGPQWPDEQLVERCLEGDHRAWAALVDKYKKLVYSVPVRYRMNAEDAADIFQAVWADAYAGLPKLRQVGALRSWLVSVASNKCYQWKKRRQRAAEAAGARDGAERIAAADVQAELERDQIFREALARLTPRCRELLQMLFYEDPPLPYMEVARRLGLAEGSIGLTRARCLDQLRRALRAVGYITK